MFQILIGHKLWTLSKTLSTSSEWNCPFAAHMWILQQIIDVVSCSLCIIFFNILSYLGWEEQATNHLSLSEPCKYYPVLMYLGFKWNYWIESDSCESPNFIKSTLVSIFFSNARTNYSVWKKLGCFSKSEGWFEVISLMKSLDTEV